MLRNEIADIIVGRLDDAKIAASAAFAATRGSIGNFVVDDLLPRELALEIFSQFPVCTGMKLKRSLREFKYIAAQMDNYNPLLEEVVYAFQDARVVKSISEICGVGNLYPDENLYAGGISLMSRAHFLNPHLDNSHDKDRNRWRVFNLLYYVAPGWELDFGGNLELWPNGPTGSPLTIPSLFNRLVLMATHERSWHSVSPIEVEANRCCVSNYYFSDVPLLSTDTFHVTSFRGRPNQPVRDVILRADISARTFLRKIFRKGIIENPHVYKKSSK